MSGNRAISVARLQRPVAVSLLVASCLWGCRPWVRFGDLQGPAGARVLVDVEVEAEDAKPPVGARPDALSDGVAGEVAFLPVPSVPASDVASELESQAQSASVPGAEALADPSRLGVDTRRIASIYQARGYFDARTAAWGIVELPGDRAKARLRVTEGAPTRLVGVEFRGLVPPEDDPEAAAILRRLAARLPRLTQVRVGAIWTEEAWVDALALVRRTFRAAGFVDAEVSGDTWVSETGLGAQALFRIDHGRIARFTGSWKALGAAMADSARIWRRVALPVGAILDARTLEAAEQRLFDLGPFMYVRLRPERRRIMPDLLRTGLLGLEPVVARPEGADASPAAPPRAGPVSDVSDTVRHDLVVEVRESAPWDLDLGFGARTDSTLLSLELPLAFNHRNVFGDLVSLHAEGRPALVFPDVYAKGAEDTRFGGLARVTLSIPTFVAEALRFDATTNYLRDVTQGASIEELSGALGWSLRLGRATNVRAGWNLSYTNYVDAAVFDLLTEGQTLEALSLRLRRTDRLAWLGASLVHDTRDSIFEARRGLFASVSLDLATPWVGSRAPFERFVVEGRTYLTPTFAPRLTLALRARAGGLGFLGGTGTSEVARLKAGGQSSMRGFPSNRLGDYLCVRDVAGDGTPINGACGEGLLDRLYVGGNLLFEANAELRLRLGDFGLVAFLDVGQLWNRLADLSVADLQVAVGPGLRYVTPIGPLRLDLGFLVGGGRQFHIGLGQAF